MCAYLFVRGGGGGGGQPNAWGHGDSLSRLLAAYCCTRAFTQVAQDKIFYCHLKL